MSKFFTHLPALLLASAGPALALEGMQPSPPPAPVLEKPGPDVPAAQGFPTALSGERFSALGKKSPFTLASTTEESADFAKDLVLAGYFRMDGKDFVLVANRTQPTRLMVGTQPSAAAQGMTLVKIEQDPSGNPTKMRAQIRKGSELAVLKYEAASAPAAQPGAGQPPPTGSVPAQTPTLPGQPQPPQVVPAAPGQKPAQNPMTVRRRMLPIPPAPSR